MVALEDAEEDLAGAPSASAGSHELRLEVAQQFPPYLLRGEHSAAALKALLGFLGSAKSDAEALRALGAGLTWSCFLQVYGTAHWLGAEAASQRVAQWLFGNWLRNPASREALPAVLGSCDTETLRAAVRAGIFLNACISERALCDAAVAAGEDGILALLREEGSGPSCDHHAAEGEQRFPIFVRLPAGRNLVMQGCAAMPVRELKAGVDARTGILQDCQRLVFQGKSLRDSQQLGAAGVGRNSTIHLSVAAHALLNPACPKEVVLLLITGSELSSSVTWRESMQVCAGETVGSLVSKAREAICSTRGFTAAIGSYRARNLMYRGNRALSLVYNGLVLGGEDRLVSDYKIPDGAVVHAFVHTPDAQA